MTHLQVINQVLRRLRETEVTAVGESDYSTLVSDLVNDAKKFVEQSHDWTGLRQTITVSTTASDYQYVLQGSGVDFKLLNAINQTSNTLMHYRPATYFDRMYMTSSSEGVPIDFTYRGADSSQNTNIEIYPSPDGVYSLEFKAVVRTADYSDGTEVFVVPTQPIIYMALALSARERGEQGGTSAAELLALADTYLADAIALDASKYVDEFVWQTV